MPRIAFLYSDLVLTEPLKALCAERLPAAETFHWVDTTLLRGIRAGDPTWIEAGRRRTLDTIAYLDGVVGCDVVVSTCSSMTPMLGEARPVRSRLLRIEDPMLEQAARARGRVGVFATLPTALDAVHSRIAPSRDAGRYVCEGAFEARTSGRVDEHNRIVAERVRAAVRDDGIEVAVFAQGSMEPALAACAAVTDRPVLGILSACVQRLAS
jgi:hypothetical protein